MGRTYAERTYHYNLVPFREIKRFLVHRETIGIMAVMLNLVGNIVAFVPYGLFYVSQEPLPLAYCTADL